MIPPAGQRSARQDGIQTISEIAGVPRGHTGEGFCCGWRRGSHVAAIANHGATAFLGEV